MQTFTNFNSFGKLTRLATSELSSYTGKVQQYKGMLVGAKVVSTGYYSAVYFQ